MSRAFVKEDGGERWEPERPGAAYRAYLLTPEGAELIREGESLAALLRWAEGLGRGEYEVRDAQGARLAKVG